MLVAAVILAAVVVAAWFPASALLHQRQQLASATTHLAKVRHQDALLHQEVDALDTPAEIERIAQEQYELVLPGQQAFQVLPPTSTSAGATYAGDPGAATPATPSTPTGSTTPATKTTGTPGKATAKGATKTTRTTAASSGSSPGFFGRVLRTLEFWR